MPELERELRALGRTIEFPATPDLVPGVRRRLGERPARAFLSLGGRPALVVALVVAAALAAVLAVPSARTALLEWLGIRGVAVTRVETAPTAPPPAEADLGLGERVSLAEAQARAGFVVARPPARAPGAPDEVYLAPIADGTQVAFVWRGRDESVELLLTQARVPLGREFAHKLAGPETTIEELTIARSPALWLAGEPHAFAYVAAGGEIVAETLRLAGNTLLWERGGTTFRLEGDVTRAEAIGIAESVPRASE